MRHVNTFLVALGLVGWVSGCSNDTTLYDPPVDYEVPIPVGHLDDPVPLDIGLAGPDVEVPTPVLEPIDLPEPVVRPPPMQVVAGYYDAESALPRGLPAGHSHPEALTHLFFGFAEVSDGECRLPEGPVATAYGELSEIRARLPELQIVMGLRTWNAELVGVLDDDQERARMAAACAKLAIERGFDGVDVAFPQLLGARAVDDLDGAPPSSGYEAFLRAIRAELDVIATQNGLERPVLTVSPPAGPAVEAYVPIDALAGLVDWVNLPAYHFEGDDPSRARLVAPLYAPEESPDEDSADARPTTVASAVYHYLQQGMPPWKIVLGVSFLGRAYADVQELGRGGLYGESWSFAWEPDGLVPWHHVMESFMSKDTAVYRDETAHAEWLFDHGSARFVSFESPWSLAAKRDFAETEALHGVFALDPTADEIAPTLLRALH